MTYNLATVQPEISYLDTLNKQQREAVEATDGPLLVLAGAGTGKTKVLTTRIAHIILSGLAYPNQILAVTFTNKAAREMTERVAGLLGREMGGLWFGTFHSICARMLRRHAEALGYNSSFTILADDDQNRLVKKIMAEFGIDEKRFPANAVLSQIQSMKDKFITPEKAAATGGNEQFVKIYEAYQRRLKTLNSMDFGDLIAQAISLFQTRPEVLADYHRQFKYVLVDEYQDTNVAQYMWLRLLAQGSRNICCVGDDDQSIYGWRGAEVGNILRFEKDFPNAQVVRLERNYRSTGHILAAASHLIAKNSDRLGKTLWTEGNHGEKVKVKFIWDGAEEAKFVASEIESLTRSVTQAKYKLSQIAILVRAGFQTRAFEERFITLNIPYRVVGGLRFYERQEIRDAIAYLRVLVYPGDDLALERIINLPKRGIGKTTLDSFFQKSRQEGISLYEAAQAMAEQSSGKSASALKLLFNNFDRWRRMMPATPPSDFVSMMLDESGYVAMWKEEAQVNKSLEAEGRVENLKEFVRAIGEFETLPAFLEHISLVMDRDDGASGDMVGIMTLHAAKGLEFEAVFLPGWEEGLFPSQRSIDEKGPAGLSEERRLAYVGITRARKTLYISHAANRRVYNQWQSSIPSRFLAELPKESVENLQSSFNFRANQEDNFIVEDEKKPVAPAAAKASEPSFAVGDKVFHEKFGYGFVNKASGDHLEVNFKNAGRKKIMAGFVQKG